MINKTLFRQLSGTFVGFLAAVGTLLGHEAQQHGSVRTIASADARVRIQQLALVSDLVPSFDRGFFVARTLDSSSPKDVNVVLLNANGTQIRQASIWLPTAVRVHLAHAVVGPKGEVLAAGYAVTSDKNTEHFIARTDLQGNIAAKVPTNPFVPRCICAASDGTVWALGAELDKADRHEDYTTLRRFSLTSGLMGEYLHRNSFPTEFSPVVVTGTSGVGNHNATYLRCSGDRVQVYVNVTNEYIEVDPATNSTRRWTVAVSEFGPVKASGFAVTGKGSAFLSLTSEPGAAHRVSGIFEIQLGDGPGVARIIPVEGMSSTGVSAGARSTPAELWGADGDDLVVRRPGEARLSWIGLGPIRLLAQ